MVVGGIAVLTLLGSLGTANAQVADGRPARVLRLEFHHDGTMSLAAAGVSTRDIMAEWARQCGCYVVNADRLPGSPLPTQIEFTRTAENRVIESILRQATGFILTPRRPDRDGPSSYETVYVVASSQTTAVAAPAFQAFTPAPAPLPTTGSPDDEVPPIAPPLGILPAPRAPADAPARPSTAAPPPRTTSPGVSVPVITPFGRPAAPTSPASPASP